MDDITSKLTVWLELSVHHEQENKISLQCLFPCKFIHEYGCDNIYMALSSRCYDASSLTSTSSTSNSESIGTNVQQKASRSFRTKDVPSGFHFRSDTEKCVRGMFTQAAPLGVHIYRWGVPVQMATRGNIGSQAAVRIGSLWMSRAASSNRAISQIQRAVGMLSLRVKT